MSKRTWLRWLPVFWTALASILLIAWAIFAESQVQGPVSSPGTLSFQAYLPSHYCIYCQIDDDLTNKESILAKMRLFPQITCRVKGADYLDVLTVNVWRAGGLTRVSQDKVTGKSKIFMPFAEFEILWPGYYELQVGSATLNNEQLLICIAPTGLLGFALILSMGMLTFGFILMLPKIFGRNIVDKINKTPEPHINEEVVVNDA